MNAATLAAALGRHTPKTGGGFMACCPAHADKNPSLAVDENGGALLVKCFAGCDQDAVIDALKAKNLWPGNSDTLPPTQKARTGQIWKPVLPVPNNTPPPPTAHHQHGSAAMTWQYLNQGGDLLQIVCRFDTNSGKQVLPLTYCTDGNRHAWRWQALPSPRPLYGLEHLAKAAHVVICEGEKAADAGRRLLGLPVLTWPGGSNAAAKADWRPLAGKTVAIWPDADEPGTKAALAVAEILTALGCTVKIAEPPADVAQGWDAADAEGEGWDRGRTLALLKSGLTPDDFRKRHTLAADEPTQDAPLLFDGAETPEISTDLLPSWLGDYAEAVARTTQTPQAMAVMLALATVATCTAKRFEVCPYGDGYTEPLNIWTATAMPPASRKTAVIVAMTAPLAEYERAEADRLAPIIKETSIKRKVLERRIDKLEKDAGNADEPARRDALQREIAALTDELPPEVIAPRLWTGDVTPERLQGLLADHGERMAVLTDEAGIFEVMAGLYSDGKANLDIFLKGHAGSAARVDRQGRTAHLDAPALSFGLAIQPAVLADMASGSKRRFRGNGTLARFLYAVPRSNVGSRDVRAIYQIPATVTASYQAGLYNLLAIPPQLIDGREVPRRLTMTADALTSWHAFAEMVEHRQGADGDLESISDWSGKLPGAALRIAGSLHLVKHGTNPPAQIEAVTLERALDLCELLIDHAKAAFALMEADPATADAKALLRWITNERLEQFKRGDLWVKFKGRFTGKTERLDKALKELEERAIVTATTEPTDGRTATLYTVNPALWEAV